MAINNEIRTAGPFTGNSGVATYSFGFKIFEASDMLVVETDLSGVSTTKTVPTDYTVSINSDQDNSPGGNVTRVAGNLPTGYLLTLTSAVPETQKLVITNFGAFLAGVINDALDRLTILVQQNANKLSRTFSIPLADGSNYIVNDLPLAANRALKALVFDAQGQPSVSVDNYADQEAAVAASAATATAAATAANADVVLTHADVVLTHADAATTATNVTTTNTNATNAGASATAAAASATALVNSWKGPWITSTAYGYHDEVSDGGSSYICILAHTSDASTEPGVGGSYSTVWQLFAAKGSPGAGTGDMLAANNLSDVANKATGRTNLGVAIGTNVQAWDADLDAVAALSSTGIAVRSASNTWAQRTVTGTSNKITVTNGNGVSGNPTLTVGSDIVDHTAANTYTGGFKQTFTSDATNAGLNVAPVAGDPSSPANGDVWYNSTSGLLKARQAGATVAVLGANTFGAAYAQVQDQQPSGTNGQSLSSGSWTTRQLGTKVTDDIGITLTSNHMVLAAGTYYVDAFAVFEDCAMCQIKLRDTTNGVDLIIGSSVYSFTSAYPTPTSDLRGRFILSGTCNVELQCQVSSSNSLRGGGRPAGFGVVEVYASVDLWKTA